jgi:hypothetical protein
MAGRGLASAEEIMNQVGDALKLSKADLLHYVNVRS